VRNYPKLNLVTDIIIHSPSSRHARQMVNRDAYVAFEIAVSVSLFQLTTGGYIRDTSSDGLLRACSLVSLSWFSSIGLEARSSFLH
jgi:hypothetical protein